MNCYYCGAAIPKCLCNLPKGNPVGKTVEPVGRWVTDEERYPQRFQEGKSLMHVEDRRGIDPARANQIHLRIETESNSERVRSAIWNVQKEVDELEKIIREELDA